MGTRKATEFKIVKKNNLMIKLKMSDIMEDMDLTHVSTDLSIP